MVTDDNPHECNAMKKSTPPKDGIYLSMDIKHTMFLNPDY